MKPKRTKAKNKEAAMPSETETSAAPVITEEGTETVGEEIETSEPEAPIADPTPEPVVETPTIAVQEVIENLSPEEAELMRLIQTYRDSIAAGGGLIRNPQNTMNFIGICSYLIQMDKMKLYQKFYEEVFKKDPGGLMDGKVVFQYLHQINHSDKAKVEMLYTAMSTLKSYLGKAKKTAFPLDFALLNQKYGGDSLVAMLRENLQL